MSEFKVGDAVKFKPSYDGQTVDLQDETSLDLYYTQTVSDVRPVAGGYDIKLLGDVDWWCATYWEPIEEWAKHQKKVDAPTELELAKVQIKALQDLKFDTQQAMEDLFCAIRDGADKEWLLQFMKQYPFNVEISE